VRHQVIRCEHGSARKCWCDEARRLRLRRGKEYRWGIADRRVLPADGMRRRLRGLAAAGFTRDRIAAELGVTRRAVDYLLFGTEPTTTAALTLTVAEVCHRLLAGPPPTGAHAKRAQTLAAKHGWRPIDAWFDIDNDPEPSTVDDIAVMHAVAGDLRWDQLDEPEQHLVVMELTGRGWSDVRIADWLRTSHSRIARARDRLGIRAVPAGGRRTA
jgi:hypothetical protein